MANAICLTILTTTLATSDLNLAIRAFFLTIWPRNPTQQTSVEEEYK
jgi:hypothetical protein